MSRSGQRRALLTSAVLVLAGLIVAVWQTSLLRAAGWWLVSSDCGPQADAIVIAIDAGSAGVLEAADLVKAGASTRVAVFADPPDDVDREFLRRGIAYEDRAAREIRELRALGVENIETIPRRVAGTEDEGSALPEWCRSNQLQSITVVTSPDHSRRLRRVLNRTMGGSPTRVKVHWSRYSLFDPDRWWQTRGGVRTEIIELQKMLLDIVRHPLS